MATVLILGRRGSGKTTLALRRAIDLNPRHVVAFDPAHRFNNFKVQTSDLKRVKQWFESDIDDSRRRMEIAYVPPVKGKKNVEEAWNKFAALLWNWTGEEEGCVSYSLIVDEADQLQSPQYLNPWLSHFLRRAPTRERGDKNPVDIILTSHRIQDFNGLVFDLTDETWFFRMKGRRARSIIIEEYDEDLQEQVFNLKTPKLGGREVIKVDSETGDSRLIEDPLTWYIDIRHNPEDVEVKVKDEDEGGENGGEE